jgi:outer membrane biosynthesis protein TonB
MSAATQYIVTTSVSGRTRTQVWDPEMPLALGHPLRWIAERTESGVRIRNLGLAAGQVATGSLCEVSQNQISAGTEVRLPGRGDVSLTIRHACVQKPAFVGRQGDRLSIYPCNGAWVMGSQLFEARYVATARVGDKLAAVFTLAEQGAQLAITPEAEGLSLKASDGRGAARALVKGQALPLTREEIVDAVVTLGTRSWRFGLSQTVALPEPKQADTDAESVWFRKALSGAAASFAALMVIAWLWPAPKPDTQELIPAQFAKIILAKPPAQVKASASEGNPTQSKTVPERVAKAAVVQAFRAKALQSAVSGLLKGGMTSLLAQSDFVAGRVSEARKSFDAKSKALASSGPATGMSADTNQKVAALGGSGQGKGAGYGKGEHAGVKGQGAAFVSMDIAGAAVDEGLTKDEVGEVIHRHLSEVRYCYESAMIRTPDLEGKLMTAFTIGGDGRVKSTEVKSSTLPDPRLDDCILRRLATWKFPEPRGGVDVAVAYPFIFKTLGR